MRWDLAGRVQAGLLVAAGLLFTTMQWHGGLMLVAALVAGSAALTFWFRPGQDAALQSAGIQFLALAAFTPASAVLWNLVDPFLLLMELASFALALVPAVYLARRARADLAWLAPAAVSAWALVPPFWAWVQHDAYGNGPHAPGCGRFQFGSNNVGEAYGQFIGSWGYFAPAAALVLVAAVASWRRRDLGLGLWSATAGMTLVALSTYGVVKYCD